MFSSLDKAQFLSQKIWRQFSQLNTKRLECGASRYFYSYQYSTSADVESSVPDLELSSVNQETVNRNLQTLVRLQKKHLEPPPIISIITYLQDEYFHREDASFSDDAEVLSQGSTRDGSNFDAIQPNVEMHSEISPFSLLSPDRRGPERKKSRVKQFSPDRVAQLNCFSRSSDATMYIPSLLVVSLSESDFDSIRNRI
jgi:hypothetical protein